MRCFKFRAQSPHGTRFLHERFLLDTAKAQVEAARYSIAIAHGGVDTARGAWTMEVSDSSNVTLFRLSFAGTRLAPYMRPVAR